MTKLGNKIAKTAAIVIGVLALSGAAAWFWLADGPLTPAKEKIFSFLPFPVAVVQERPITTQEYLKRYRLAIENGSPANADTAKAVFERLIEEVKLEVVAGKRGLIPSQQAIEEEFMRRSEASAQAGKNLVDLLSQAGLEQGAYRDRLIKSELAAAGLQSWFYGQRNLNAEGYSLADSLMQKINAGQDFAALAERYSLDAQTGQLGGDLGFLDPGSLLPEVVAALEQSPAGQASIVPTRYGIEIIRLENKGQAEQLWHLRHISVKQGGFEQWYLAESKNIKILKIFNP